MFPVVLFKKLTPAPTLLTLIFQITTGFLLCTTSTFSEAFLVRFESNNTHSNNQVQISAGFISICSHNSKNIICTSRTNTTSFGKVEADAEAPIRMAIKFSKNIVSPVPVCGAFLFTIIGLFATLWHSVTFMPFRLMVHRIALFSTVLACVFWFLGAVWLQVAIDSVRDIVNSSEMHNLHVRAGHRAGGMTWAAFSLLLLSSGLSAMSYRKEVININQTRAQGKSNSV